MTSLWQFQSWDQNDQKWLKIAPKGPNMNLKVLKVTSETISIEILLLLRSFWVFTWLACDNFKFWAKMTQNSPQIGPKWHTFINNIKMFCSKKINFEMVPSKLVFLVWNCPFRGHLFWKYRHNDIFQTLSNVNWLFWWNVRLGCRKDAHPGEIVSALF